jgi:hypothetical protein
MPLLRSFRVRMLTLAAMPILLAQVGCSRNHTARVGAETSVPVVFSNESTVKADVWVLAPGVNTRRIGSVLAGETTTLRAPREFYEKGTISFYAQLRGNSIMPLLDKLPVAPGEELRLRLPIDTKRIAVVR